MTIVIRSYSRKSHSAQLLKDKLKEIGRDKVYLSFKNAFKPDTFIINWGKVPQIIHNNQCNQYVGAALDKRRALYEIGKTGKITVPEWTFNKELATKWVKEGHKVYCRTLVSANGGKGIVIAETPEQVVDAPLYTKRFPNGREYRVHVAFGDVIQIVQKKARKGFNADPLVRSNLAWVFARNIDPVPNEILDVSTVAINALGLDFGAVDILWSVKNNQPCVLEVNTAPGLDNFSAASYAHAFLKEMGKG